MAAANPTTGGPHRRALFGLLPVVALAASIPPPRRGGLAEALPRLKAAHAAASRPGASQEARLAYSDAARVALATPAVSLACLAVKAWIADPRKPGGDPSYSSGAVVCALADDLRVLGYSA